MAASGLTDTYGCRREREVMRERELAWLERWIHYTGRVRVILDDTSVAWGRCIEVSVLPTPRMTLELEGQGGRCVVHPRFVRPA